jgi:hypothetical protein
METAMWKESSVSTLLALLIGCGTGAPVELANRKMALDSDANVALLWALSNMNLVDPDAPCNSPYIDANVRVKNLAYEKQVALVVRNPTDGSWEERAGQWLRMTGTDYEEWKVFTCLDFPGDYEFAVKYTVNGTDYWDNNGGSNYLLTIVDPDINGGELLTSAVQLTDFGGGSAPYFWPSVMVPGGMYPGYVWVQNLAYEKKVTIVYTTDNWASTQTVAAGYYGGPDPNGFEQWSFSFSAPTSPGTLELTIAYDVAGTTYWDSDFGYNYQVQVMAP